MRFEELRGFERPIEPQISQVSNLNNTGHKLRFINRFLLSGLQILDFKIPIDKDKIVEKLLEDQSNTLQLEKGRIVSQE